MEKRAIAFVFLFMLTVSLITGIGLVSAAVTPIQTGGSGNSAFLGFLNTEHIVNNFGNGVLSGYTSVLFLLLIIFLVYSSLSFAGFPESAGLRWGISAIVGVLGIILLTSSDVTAILYSYKALGVAIIIFLPLVILGAFTFMVATKINPFGIVLQHIAWIIFSVFLFFQSLGLLILRLQASTGWFSSSYTSWMKGFFAFLFGSNFPNLATNSGSTLILIVLLAVSIAVFYFFVVKNRLIIEWFQRERQNADLLRYRDTAQRANAARQEDANATRT